MRHGVYTIYCIFLTYHCYSAARSVAILLTEHSVVALTAISHDLALDQADTLV